MTDSTMKIMNLLTHKGTVETGMSYAEKANKSIS
jgi:hypothetical protein